MAAGVAALLLASVAVAHATSLGGLTAKTLLAISPLTSSAAPIVIGCDNFTGATGASIAARVATDATACSNRVWTAHAGAWKIQSNQAASNAADAVATENTTTVDSTVQVVLSNVNAGGRSGGVVLSHDGVSNYLAAVMTNATPNRIELRLADVTGSVVLSTFTPTFTGTDTLRLTRAGAALSIGLNGVTVGTYTLTSAQLATLGSGTRAGVVGGSASVRFDDFVVTTP